MSSYQKQKVTIFIGVFLILSIGANIALAFFLTSQNETLNSLTLKLEQKAEQFFNLQVEGKKRKEQLDDASELQSELASKIGEIGNEIVRLETYQTEIDKTVALIKEQLDKTRTTLVKNSADLNSTKQSLTKNLEELENSKQKLKDNSAELRNTRVKLKRNSIELEKAKQELKNYSAELKNTRQELITNTVELETTKLQLKEAQGTIHNQQRALRKTTLSNDQLSPGAQAVLLELSKKFSGNDPVRIVQSTDSIQVNIPINVLFSSKRPMLDISALRWLSPIAEALSTQSEVNVHIIGHTDARPIDPELSQYYASNWELSSARASRIAAELVSLGVPAKNMLASGKSSFTPVRELLDKNAWLVNHRIEIIIK